MEEILDIYDANKVKTEKKHIRGNDTLKANEYVVVVETLILNSKGQILLGQRSENKKRNPLKWESMPWNRQDSYLHPGNQIFLQQ